jgi:hypothetical protein
MRSMSEIDLTINCREILRKKFYVLFNVSYFILKLWKHVVDNNEMVYLTKSISKCTPKSKSYKKFHS